MKNLVYTVAFCQVLSTAWMKLEEHECGRDQRLSFLSSLTSLGTRKQTDTDDAIQQTDILKASNTFHVHISL